MSDLEEIDERIKLIKEQTKQLINDPEVRKLDQKVLAAFKKTSRLFKEYFSNTEIFKQEPEEFNYDFMKKFVSFFKKLEYLPEEVLTTMLGNFTQSIYEGLDKRIKEQNLTVNKGYQKINSTAHLLTNLVNNFKDYKREMNQKYEDLTTKFNEVLDLTSTVMRINNELQQGLSQILAKPLQCIPSSLVQELSQGLNKMSSSIKKLAPANKEVKTDSINYHTVYELLYNNPGYITVSKFKESLSEDGQKKLELLINKLVNEEVINRSQGRFVLINHDSLHKHLSRYDNNIRKKEFQEQPGLNQRLLNNFCVNLELNPKTKYILRSFPENKKGLKNLIEEFEQVKAVTNNELTNPDLMYSIINEKFGFKLESLADLKTGIMNYLTSTDGLTFGHVYNKFKSFDKKIVKKVIHALKKENKINTKQGSNYIMVV
ncbi:hypothetical protein GF352_04035 [archaeon]|nr:hypothetical protein [archaeon]